MYNCSVFTLCTVIYCTNTEISKLMLYDYNKDILFYSESVFQNIYLDIHHQNFGQSG